MARIKLKTGIASSVTGANISIGEPFIVTDTQKMGFSPDGSTKIILISETDAKNYSLLFASSF